MIDRRKSKFQRFLMHKIHQVKSRHEQSIRDNEKIRYIKSGENSSLDIKITTVSVIRPHGDEKFLSKSFDSRFSYYQYLEVHLENDLFITFLPTKRVIKFLASRGFHVNPNNAIDEPDEEYMKEYQINF